MHVSPAEPSFTDEQKRRLIQLGVHPEQIRTLEVIALPNIRNSHRKLAALKDVEEELASCRKPLDDLRKRLGKLVDSLEAAAPDKREALRRLNHAERQLLRAENAIRPDAASNDESLGTRMQTAISDLERIFSIAMQGLPRDDETGRLAQRRKETPVAPIESIWSAIGGYDFRWSGCAPSVPFSASSDSDFFHLVKTCFEAAGLDRDHDPEYAIQLFGAWLEEADSASGKQGGE